MKSVYILLFIGLIPAFGFSQNHIRPSAYFQDMLLYNPAALPIMNGENNRLILNARTKIIPENQPIWNNNFSLFANYLKVNDNNNSYFHIGYIHDKYSFFNRNSIYVGYGKRISLGENSSITFGGNYTFHTDLVSWSNFMLPHDQTGRSFRLSPDLDLGTQFQWKGLKIGASVKNLVGISQKIEEETVIKTQRVVVINTSYEFIIGERITIAPYFLLFQELKTDLDAGLFLSFDNKINASYLMRITELRSILTLESQVFEGFSIGASYDTSPLFPDNNFDIFVRRFF